MRPKSSPTYWSHSRGTPKFPASPGKPSLAGACWAQTDEKMLNITHYQRNANQNHNEVPFHSEEAVPGPSVFPSREPGVSGKFWGSHEGCQVPFRTSGRNMGLPLRRRSGQGPHLAKTLKPRVFSRFAVGFSSDDRDYRLPPLLALGSPVFHSSGEGKLGAALSHCRANETSSRHVSRT